MKRKRDVGSHWEEATRKEIQLYDLLPRNIHSNVNSPLITSRNTSIYAIYHDISIFNSTNIEYFTLVGIVIYSMNKSCFNGIKLSTIK